MDYKEILKGIVNIINTTEKSDIGFANICSYICENCPELKESEDERIRKRLIDFFEDWHENRSHCRGIAITAILAWLEKQGKQKPTSDTRYEVGAGGSLSVNGKPFDYEHATITQKDFACDAEEASYTAEVATGDGSIKTVVSKKVSLPNPQSKEWSEGDEREMKRIIGLLEGWLSTFKETCYAEDCKCGIDWLRSLKNRVQPRPIIEWGEEDELNLKGIIDEIEANKSNAPSYDIKTYDRFLNWLKSLKDRIGG